MLNAVACAWLRLTVTFTVPASSLTLLADSANVAVNNPSLPTTNTGDIAYKELRAPLASLPVLSGPHIRASACPPFSTLLPDAPKCLVDCLVQSLLLPVHGKLLSPCAAPSSSRWSARSSFFHHRSRGLEECVESRVQKSW